MIMIEQIELLLKQAITTQAVELCKIYYDVEMDLKTASERKSEIVEKHRNYLELIKHLNKQNVEL